MLSSAHRRFLVVEQLIGAAVVNFAINAGLGWLVFRRAPSVRLYGSPGIAVDTVVTAFVLPLLTALVAAWAVKLRVARGQLPPLDGALAGGSAWARRSAWSRGALLGLGAVVIVALPTVALLAWAGVEAWPRARFIWFKGAFAAAVGMLVTPPLGWWALADASRARATPDRVN